MSQSQSIAQPADAGERHLSVQEKSRLFTSYNHMRGAGAVERGRLNRALGLVQSGEERPYVTTETSCTCPDFQYRGGACKHLASRQLKDATTEAPAVKSTPVDFEDLNDILFG